MVRFSFLAIVCLLCAALSYARTNFVDVQAICKQAQDPPFCLAFLKSRPGGQGKNLGDLDSYTLGVLHTDVSNTITLITKLIAESANDLNKQSHYKTCLDFFGDERALGRVKDAEKELANSNYVGVGMHMGTVMNFVTDCLWRDNNPIKDTSLLPKNAGVVTNIAEIVAIISNMLT